ncbi:MAG: 50S ribosomal protein L23 [Thermotogae bacterium]|nr:50S ribosomal protein L23 [Thermotogota bacterium]
MEKLRAYDIITRPVLTEKSYMLMQDRKYTFEVSRECNKTDVKEAIEALYGVKVEKVFVMNVKGKVKRMGKNEGKTRSWKKAIVKLADGYVIKELQGNI